MPPAKRNKKASKEEDDREVVCTLVERVDATKLENITQLWLSPSNASCASSLLATVVKSSGWNHAVYKRAKGNFGRVYAGSSLQTLKGWITRVVAGHFYTEIDIHGCAPTIVHHLAESLFGINLPMMEQYIVDRAELFERTRTQTPALQNASDAVLKKAFLVAMHGGSYKKFFRENHIELDVYDCPPLAAWVDECARITTRLKNDDAFQFEQDNGDASFLAHAWQSVEVRVLMLLKEFFTNQKMTQTSTTVGVLKHDAVLIEYPFPDVPFPDEVLQAAVRFVRKTIDIKYLQLAEKKLTPTKADWDLFYGAKRLDAIHYPLEKVVHLVSFDADKHNYKRMNDQLYVEHKTIPCVWAPLKPLLEYINEVTTAAHHSTPPMTQCMDWAQNVDHPRFRILRPCNFDDSKIAFLNGYMDVTKGNFVPWDAVKPDFFTCHYFEKNFDMGRLHADDTPLWTNLLDYQLAVRKPDGQLDRSCCKLFEATIGRLFVPIGSLDNWQIAPSIIGDANTGKSTIATIVTHMFPPHQVGVIGSSMEDKFGLESFLGKRIIICPDMPVNMHKVVDAANLQSMVTGDPMLIPRKNKSAIQTKWSAPSLWCGNRAFSYTDRNGSIWRRFPLFPFRNLVKNRDTTMQARILNDELVQIIGRCVASYHQHRVVVGSADFWAHVPPMISQGQEEMRNATDELSNFIANGSSYYQIIKKPGAMTNVRELAKAFTNYMQFEKKRRGVVMGSDLFPIKAAGFVIETKYGCKMCPRPHGKINCGTHYDRQNRQKMQWVVDMEILTIKDMGEFVA